MWGAAIDCFHNCFEGVSKLMLIRIFINHNTKETRELLAEITFIYLRTRVFSETARKPRKIQVKMLKGNELAVLTLTVFPVIAYYVIDGDTNYWFVQACYWLITIIYIFVLLQEGGEAGPRSVLLLGARLPLR